MTDLGEFYYGKIHDGEEVEFYFQDSLGNIRRIKSVTIRKNSEADNLMIQLLKENENDR